MKKITILGLIVVATMFSCKKEEVEPTTEEPIEETQCNCGIVANDGIDDGCYWLEIRNDCSGNKKQFCFDEDFWMDQYPGDDVCVTNVDEW